MLERCWPAIWEVAAQLFSHSHARHDDVAKGLGLSADPETAAIEVAHIRAGCAPDSFTVRRPVPA
jgi:hypothetical protein